MTAAKAHTLPALRFDWNALCEFERVSGQNVFDSGVIRRMARSAATLRAAWWSGQLHLKAAPTLEQAGEQLARVPLAVAVEAVTEAFAECLRSLVETSAAEPGA